MMHDVQCIAKSLQGDTGVLCGLLQEVLLRRGHIVAAGRQPGNNYITTNYLYIYIYIFFFFTTRPPRVEDLLY